VWKFIACRKYRQAKSEGKSSDNANANYTA
jgi:hypothetical protein